MFATPTPMPMVNLYTVPGNVFDLVVLLLLAVGLGHGLKRGMSLEALPLIRDLATVAICGCFYESLGDYFTDFAKVTALFAYTFVYVVLLLGTSILFSVIKQSVGEKLVGNALFGRGERVLGMLAGMLRYACYVVLGVAILNGPVYTPEELAADAAERRGPGSSQMPSLGQIQAAITKDSVTSHIIHNSVLNEALIKPTPTNPPPSPHKHRPPLQFLQGLKGGKGGQAK
jgi:uncharacterized membrane protein required for colicin V production